MKHTYLIFKEEEKSFFSSLCKKNAKMLLKIQTKKAMKY